MRIRTMNMYVSQRVGMVVSLLAALAAAPALAADKVTYNDHVVPILRNHCFSCHNSDKKKADLDVSTYNTILAGGGSGEALAAGNPSDSLLFKLINHLEEPKMPPKSPKIPDGEIAVIKNWIEGGLLENSGSKAIVSKKPKVDLALKSTSTGRPEGDPPMPGGDLLLEPVIHTDRAGAVTAIATSPWAPLVAVAGQKQVILYDIDTLEIQGILPFPEGFPYVLKFSRNGQLLLVGGGVGAKLGKVVLFDVKTGKRVTEVGDEYDAVIAADLSPDQSQVAVGGPSKLVRIYSTSTGELVESIKKHTDWVTAIAFSPDGVLLATGDRNGGVHVWEAETARPYSELKAHQQAVTDITWRDDSNIVATAGEEGQIMLWGLENSNRIRNWGAHGGGVQSVRFAHDGRLVSIGRDKTTKLWDGNGGQQRAFDAFGDIGLVVAISHDQSRVVAGDFTGEIRVWNAADGKLTGKLSSNPPKIDKRLDDAGRYLALKQTEHDKVAAARAAALDGFTKAEAALTAARKNAGDTAAAATAAQAAMNAAKQTHAQAVATKDSAQKDAEAKQNDLNAKKTVLASATESLNKMLGVVKPTAEAITAAEAALKAAEESYAKAKAAADAMADMALLVNAAAKAKMLVDDSAAALAMLQAGMTDVQGKVKASEVAVSGAKAVADQAEAAYAAAAKVVTDTTTALAAADANMKATIEGHQKALAAADVAGKAVAPVEAQTNASRDAERSARIDLIIAEAEVSAAQRRIAYWKAAQFNVQVLATGHELDEKQALAEATLAHADNLKAIADRTAVELASVQKALGEAPALMKAKEEEVSKAKAALDGANAALPNLKNDLAAKQAGAKTQADALAVIATDLAKVQSVLKAAQESVVSSEASAKASADSAVKAKAAADAMSDMSMLVESSAKAQQVAAESAAALESARRAAEQVAARVKTLTDEHAKAKASLDVANQAVVVAQQALDNQPNVIKQMEAAFAAATDVRAKSQAMVDALPGKLAALEPAAKQSSTDAAAAREMANKTTAEVAPLKQKYEGLVAEYQKLKTQG
ncbi:MAG: c-type cytochrome domain-containing protein [Phycisphaeraceae bacterium]